MFLGSELEEMVVQSIAISPKLQSKKHIKKNAKNL